MRVQIPEKNTYVDFPDDLSPEEVSRAIDSNWDNIEASSTLSEMGRGAKRTLEGIVGLGETAGMVGSGLVGQAAGGIVGLRKLIGGTPEEAAQESGRVAEALTYKPQTESGKHFAEGVEWGMEKVAELGKLAGETTQDILEKSEWTRPLKNIGATAADVLTQTAALAPLGVFRRTRPKIGPREMNVRPSEVALEKTRGLYPEELPPGPRPAGLLEAGPELPKELPPGVDFTIVPLEEVRVRPPEWPDWTRGERKPETIVRREETAPRTAEEFKGPERVFLKTKSGQAIEAAWNPETKRYEPIPEQRVPRKPFEEGPLIIGEDPMIKQVETSFSKPAFQRNAEDLALLRRNGFFAPPVETPSGGIVVQPALRPKERFRVGGTSLVEGTDISRGAEEIAEGLTFRQAAENLLGKEKVSRETLAQIKEAVQVGRKREADVLHNLGNELQQIALDRVNAGADMEAQFSLVGEVGKLLRKEIVGQSPFRRIFGEERGSFSWRPKAGDFVDFIDDAGKQQKGKVRDFDRTTGKVWIFPADRSLIKDRNSVTVEIPLDRTFESGAFQAVARVPKESPQSEKPGKGGGGTTLYSNPFGAAARFVKEKVIDPVLNLETSEGDTLKDWTIRKLQDKFLPLKQLQEKITGPTRSLVDRLNTYRAEELRSGKTYYALDLSDHTFTKPFVDALKTARKSGISLDDLDQYLTAKHAPERNATIQARNERFTEGGSGMTDAEAQAVLDGFDAKGKTTDLEGLAKKIWEINKKDWDLRREYGLISEELYKAKLNEWKHYVPLRGKEGVPERPNIGQGVSVKTGFKGALGRKSLSESPVLNSLAQLEETIIRGEKNKVGNVFLEFVQTGLKKGWLSKDDVKINAVSEKARFNPKTGQVEFVNAPDSWAKSQDVFTTLKDGTAYSITIENNPLLVRALKNLGADKSGKIVQALSMFNRYLSMIKTSINPEFAVTNPIRDAMTATLNLSAEKSTGMARAVLRDLPKAMRGAYQGFKFELGTQWAKHADEYRQQGGAIGFYSMKDLETRGRIIERELAAAAGKIGPRSAHVFRQGLNVIKDLTGAGENAMRLSAYVNARKMGYSQAQAASLAKNLTVNFNRHGEWGPLMNAAYMFFNANVQGTARFLEAAKKNPKRFAAYGSAALGFSVATAELNRAIMGQDKDGISFYDKIDANTKSRNLILPNPLSSKKDAYTKIPLPYGYNIFHAMGQTIDGLANDKQKKVGTGVLELGGALSDAFNPLGNMGNFVSGISPTVLDPAVELAMNRNWAGVPIRPEEFPGAPPKPESQRYFKSVTGASKAIAQGLNAATGGNEVRSGAVDISPEWIDYMSSYFLGGAGDFIRRSGDVIARVYNGEEIPIKDVPLARRFAGEKNEYFDTQKFIQNLKEAQTNLEEYKRYGKAQDEGMLEFAERGQALTRSFSEMHHDIKEIERTFPPAEAKALRKRIEEAEGEEKMAYNKDVLDYVKKKRQARERQDLHPVLTEQMTPFRRSLP